MPPTRTAAAAADPRRRPPREDHQFDSPREEVASALTHGLGAALSVAGLAVLVTLAARHGGPVHVASVAVFGAALVLTYGASACLHACRCPRRRYWLNWLDHTSIYLLIAGTYTPILLVLVRGGWGWGLFATVWGLAAAGVAFKFLCFGRYSAVSTGLYVLMGWVGIVAARPMLERLPGEAMALIVAGGVAYTLGVAFFLWRRLPYHHAIWHLFVMAGSGLHFAAVLRHVIPDASVAG